MNLISSSLALGCEAEATKGKKDKGNFHLELSNMHNYPSLFCFCDTLRGFAIVVANEGQEKTEPII